MRIEVHPEAQSVAREAAAFIATQARACVDARGRFLLALSGGSDLPLDLSLTGTYNDAPFRVTGSMGSMLSLVSGEEDPWPLAITAEAGGATVAVKGKIGNPAAVSGLDIDVDVSGQDLSALGALAQAPVPPLGPYAIKAKIAGALDKAITVPALSVKRNPGKRRSSSTVSCDCGAPLTAKTNDSSLSTTKIGRAKKRSVPVERLGTPPEDVTSTFTVPQNLGTGVYHVGVVLDPDSLVPELNETNNVGTAVDTLTLTSRQVVILTDALPVATLTVSYRGRLSVIGGDGTYTYRLTRGTVPRGMLFRASAGEIFGVPLETGAFPLEFEVRRALDGPDDAVAPLDDELAIVAGKLHILEHRHRRAV